MKERSDNMSYIEFKNVSKKYIMGEVVIHALDDTNFSIEKGELVVIVRTKWCRENYYFKYIRWNGYCYIRQGSY